MLAVNLYGLSWLVHDFPAVVQTVGENWVYVSIALIEIGLRLYPTGRKASILRFIAKILDYVVPDRERKNKEE